jgi:SAM-dependent methyltransferase
MAEAKKWQNHRGLVIDSATGFDVIECEMCRFKHIIPLPTAEELSLIYRHEYYSIDKPFYLKRVQEDLDWWNLVYNERYGIFEELLSPAHRRILDVGSGAGYFLLRGKERGWQALGIEPSTIAAAHTRSLGLTVVEGFLTEEIAGKLGTFDVVHMSEVLEHVPGPQRIMNLAGSLLNPGGLLCTVVPNDYNPFQTILREVCGYRPWWVAPPHHINYFNFSSLTGLFESCGLEVILRDTTFPIDMFLLMGDNYVDDDALGRQCHGKRKTFEEKLSAGGMEKLKQELYRGLAANGIGREVFLIGRTTEGKPTSTSI